MATPEKQQPTAVVLRENCIVEGQFYAAGVPVPFEREADLPESLRPLVATGDEDFYTHSERNIYFGQSGGRGRARRILGNIQLQDACEDAALAEQALPPETLEALEDAHAKASALGKAQIQFNRDQTDAAYESAARQAEETQTQYFVRRGGEMARVERAKLKPGETCFVKRPNGEFEASGFIDANGTWPEPEIYP